MGLSEFFGWGSGSTPTEELPDIFPIPIAQVDFIRTDVQCIFVKILTDVVERTHGLNDDQVALLWDSCVMANSQDGVITMLASAMSEKSEIFLVFEPAVNVVRRATPAEEAQIRSDYSKQSESKVGVFVSFKNFKRSDMVKLYSALEYCTVGGLYKTANLSKAIQLKFNDLRASVSLTDKAEAKAQAQSIAKSLGAGRDVMLDAKDLVETAKPDLEAVEKAVDFLNERRSFYLGLPAAYMTGVQTTGMGTTGENDTKAIERGLKNYFVSIVKPVLEALFAEVTLSYKTQDFRNVAGAMDVLKVFALTDDTLVSHDNKTKIVNSLLDLPEDSKGDAASKPLALPAPATTAGPPAGSKPPNVQSQ